VVRRRSSARPTGGEAFPTAGDVLPAVSPEDLSHPVLDAAVAEVRAHAAKWAATSARDRVTLVDRLVRDVRGVSDAWIDECTAAEGLAADDPASAEEAITGPYAVLRYLRALRRSLVDIDGHGPPRPAGGVRALPNGQAAARVFPADNWDRLLFMGVSADVWMQPGVDISAVAGTQAVAYRGGVAGSVTVAGAEGAAAATAGLSAVTRLALVAGPVPDVPLCLVLGAGNVSAIAVLDSLTRLFVEGHVVVLKTHPVQAHMEPVLEQAMAALVEAGVLRIVTGGADVGAYLAHHPGIDEIHITGSDRTYEAIVYGRGEEGRRRRAADEASLDKPISAELGSVTPVIVVPGRWSASDLEYQADNVATMLTNNAGFNCVTARVIVTHAGWPQRGAFLDALRRRLAATPSKLAFYPGAHERFAHFAAAHPDGEKFGERGKGRLPWLLVSGLDPDRHDDPCYRTEAFCGVFGETAIEAPSVAEFVDSAVEFANGRLWGSLNATLIVSGRSMREPVVRDAVERAIANLRYGTVSINHWSAMGFVLGQMPWGAFPGHDRTDIQSGTGNVHNALMFSRPEKVVVRAPFRTRPKPVWFSGHTTAHRLARRMVRFEASPSLVQLPPILALALRG
jgi:acyl-CoA reductase-like NAD-dependent aldehyde dehydrogenase